MRGISWIKCATLAAAVGLSAAAYTPARGQVLFTTTSDFASWSVDSPAVSAIPSVTYDYDGSTTNGMGNNPGNSGASINAGGTSAGGSLALTTNGMAYGTLAYSPGEAYNPYFMSAIDPGSIAAYSAASGYGAGTTVAYNGTLQLTYTAPTLSDSAYFQIGIFLKYDNHNYNPIFPVNVTDDGTVDGIETYTATYSYSIDPGSLTYGDFEIFSNSNSSATTTIYVDDIQVLPEPASIGLFGAGALLALRRRHS